MTSSQFPTNLMDLIYIRTLNPKHVHINTDLFHRSVLCGGDVKGQIEQNIFPILVS